MLPTLQLKQVPLDAVVLSLKELPQSTKPVAVNNDPPTIFHADRPASLVVFDGDPVLAPAGNSGLKFAVNTNWDVFFDPAGKGTWYLLNNGIWFAAPAATGAYAPVSRLPAAFAKLPADTNFADARKAMPAKSVAPAQVPSIFVSTRPAEIIVTEGALRFAAVPGTGLQYVKNTASDLFFDKAQGRFYYLTSGRWFSAPGLDGPWTFASNDLPPDFALIPPDGAGGEALASVPGTSQAQLAVLKAQIPQQATLKRADARLTVSYAGTPEFRPIPGTDLAYAVNTAFEVLETGGKYYVCYQGAWFVGATPNGPWTLADSIPPAIHSIPPSSPVYNVSYVNVYGSTAETVTYGYTAGYAMGYVAAGVLVYGTGYYYPPYVMPGVVPVFFPYPYSYAGSVWYNPAVGAWARGGTVYGPYAARSPRAARTIRRPVHGPAAARCTGPMVVPVPGRPTTPPPAPTHTAALPGDRTAAPPTPASTIHATASPAARRRMPMPIRVGAPARSADPIAPSTRRAPATHAARPERSAPAPAPRPPASTQGQATTPRSPAPPAATCMPAPTATPTSTPTTAGRSGTAAAGSR